jgi:hypothetical protein
MYRKPTLSRAERREERNAGLVLGWRACERGRMGMCVKVEVEGSGWSIVGLFFVGWGGGWGCVGWVDNGFQVELLLLLLEIFQFDVEVEVDPRSWSWSWVYGRGGV